MEWGGEGAGSRRRADCFFVALPCSCYNPAELRFPRPLPPAHLPQTPLLLPHPSASAPSWWSFQHKCDPIPFPMKTLVKTSSSMFSKHAVCPSHPLAPNSHSLPQAHSGWGGLCRSPSEPCFSPRIPPRVSPEIGREQRKDGRRGDTDPGPWYPRRGLQTSSHSST